MLHLYDRATMAHALTLDLEPRLHGLLSERVAALTEDLIDYTEYLVVVAGDTEQDIVEAIGLSPMVDPIDGVRYAAPGFHPHWDWLVEHAGWYEMIITFGSAFACVLLIENAEETLPALCDMCRRYSRGRR